MKQIKYYISRLKVTASNSYSFSILYIAIWAVIAGASTGLVSFLCHYDLGTLKQCNGVKSKNESVLDLLISQRDEKPSFMKNHISENNSFF